MSAWWVDDPRDDVENMGMALSTSSTAEPRWMKDFRVSSGSLISSSRKSVEVGSAQGLEI